MRKENEVQSGPIKFMQETTAASFLEYALLASLVCGVCLLALLALCKNT